jgi:hypothetical protein
MPAKSNPSNLFGKRFLTRLAPKSVSDWLSLLARSAHVLKKFRQGSFLLSRKRASSYRAAAERRTGNTIYSDSTT